ncbi:hypothetical protein B5F33_06015 [Collinsella sp. An2]|nr:hypothetical protein B5F33_06015 [Collinsella sp. An2]
MPCVSRRLFGTNENDGRTMSTVMQREAAVQIPTEVTVPEGRGDLSARAAEDPSATLDKEVLKRWRMGFHIMPPTGWLNDPNGLCQFRGVYHVFHQYSPEWPQPHAPRGWGHVTSRDLVRWEHHGMVLAPDTPDDASGAYSGSAAVVPGAASDGGDQLRLYYTGNVKEPGDHDYIHTGRQANEILVTSDDAQVFSAKRVFMRNADYPVVCSLHVRDPKVWQQDGCWWMLLGARDLFDRGMVLIYRSEDGLAWEEYSIVRPTAEFGFMWECPDRICLDGCEYLALCPQGMEERPWANGQRDQAGYIPLEAGERLIDVTAVDPARFERWDKGFDFYAPQTFVDDAGRTILIGWMGMPIAPYESAPAGLAWCHCLTVPRLLTRGANGLVAQVPVPELEALRESHCELASSGKVELDGRRADVVLDGIAGDISLVLDGVLEIACAEGELSLVFHYRESDGHSVGAGRTRRTCAAGELHDLRVLVDGSAVEVFANGGLQVMATRWFPTAEHLSLELRGTCASADIWSMGDGMAETYRSADR